MEGLFLILAKLKHPYGAGMSYHPDCGFMAWVDTKTVDGYAEVCRFSSRFYDLDEFKLVVGRLESSQNMGDFTSKSF